MKRLLRDTLLSALFFALLWGVGPAFAGAGCGVCAYDNYCPSGSATGGFRCASTSIHHPDGTKTTTCDQWPSDLCGDWGPPEY